MMGRSDDPRRREPPQKEPPKRKGPIEEPGDSPAVDLPTDPDIERKKDIKVK